MGALSLAQAVAMAQPLEQGLTVSILGVHLGERAGLDAEELRRVLYVALLRHVGCTAESHAFATLVGDDIAFRQGSRAVELADPSELLAYTLRHFRRSAAAPRAALMLGRFLLSLGTLKTTTAAICEVAELMAERLGFETGVRRAVALMFERWDGKGMPTGAQGEGIPIAVRVVQVADAAHAAASLGGDEAAVAVLRRRSGRAYDPALVERFCADPRSLLAACETSSPWDDALALEPEPPATVPEDGLDSALRAMGEFADLQSAYTTGHSAAVAGLAGAAGERAGLAAADCLGLRRAGHVHDLGRVGISPNIWDKRGPLTHGEWERVRLHPYFGERMLARPERLRQLGALASLHHERLDGSGYHRALRAPQLSSPARILAATEAYQAMTEPRPHRGALSVDQAAAALDGEVRAGRLDRDAADAVLAAAGHRLGRRRELAAGLTPRELEVLRLLAHGLSTREIARELVVSPKTADAHIQHIYAKIGVSTRAGATMWAMQRDLVSAGERSGELPTTAAPR